VLLYVKKRSRYWYKILVSRKEKLVLVQCDCVRREEELILMQHSCVSSEEELVLVQCDCVRLID
jgi:hypothetical protein